MKLAHTIGLIENLPLFQGLDAPLVEKIAKAARVMRVLKRDIVYRKGDVCDGFYLVSYGRIRLSLFSSQGLEKPIQIAGMGNSFGDATMLQELAHYTTGIAVEDSGLVFVPKDVVTELLQSDGRLAMRMLANLAYRLHLMVDDIDDFLLQPPAARLATYLLRLIPPRSIETRNVQLFLHKHLMAAQLNLKPETLSRYFRQFCSQGLIELDGSRITIFSVDRLCQYGSSENMKGVAGKRKHKLL